ncbi:response regulator [Synechococcus sp. PCC 7336]|uniref:response regulator n=1 Tax=Synechococcus sp. PCC 7336 TaxID=195250 RepID=UPI000348BEB0|nr:response regulator [Synechococcus sp. PCC 7336]
MSSLQHRNLEQYITTCSQSQFTGLFVFDGLNGCQWNLRFLFGRLIGDSGGCHPYKRWRRQLRQYAPDLNPNYLESLNLGSNQMWSYQLVSILLEQKVINRRQAIAMIRGSAIEVLFDLAEQESTKRHANLAPLSYSIFPEDDLALQHTQVFPLKVDYLWENVERQVQAWFGAELDPYHPNLAPIITNREQLQQRLSETSFAHLSTLLKEKSTLRDISLAIGKDVVSVARLFKPYVRSGEIDLIEQPDDLAFKTSDLKAQSSRSQGVTQAIGSLGSKNKSSARKPKQNGKLNVAYIDDSPIDSKTMKQILIEHNLNPFLISDTVNAIPTLLEISPSLIFLDLVMPVANGYEICAQLRRTSKFKNTPIIIVTSSDGVIDRVRAKLVGADGFIAKPIAKDIVADILQQYLYIAPSKLVPLTGLASA